MIGLLQVVILSLFISGSHDESTSSGTNESTWMQEWVPCEQRWAGVSDALIIYEVVAWISSVNIFSLLNTLSLSSGQTWSREGS